MNLKKIFDSNDGKLRSIQTEDLNTKITDSSEERGYIDYTFSVKDLTLTRVGSGVCNEEGIGFYERYYSIDDFAHDWNVKKAISFYEETSRSKNYILCIICQFLAKCINQGLVRFSSKYLPFISKVKQIISSDYECEDFDDSKDLVKLFKRVK